MKHTLVARVMDQPGVLNRVASLFRRRAFNIDSLTVGHTETPEFSRMTIVVDTAKVPAPIVAANLRKLIPVAEVTDVTHLATVDRLGDDRVEPTVLDDQHAVARVLVEAVREPRDDIGHDVRLDGHRVVAHRDSRPSGRRPARARPS